MSNLSKFAERLDELMFDRGITPQILASAINVDSTTITRYIANKRSPSVNNLILLANYFNCSCEYLTGRINEDYKTTFHTCPPFSEQLTVLKNKFQCAWKDFYCFDGITESRFFEWKNGKRVPSLDSIILLAEGFSCSIDFIIGRTKD